VSKGHSESIPYKYELRVNLKVERAILYMDTTDDEGIDSYVQIYSLPSADFRFYPRFLATDLAEFYFDSFRDLPFASGKVRGGSERRMSCFFSDLRNPDGSLRNYQYSGKDNPALPFPPEMRVLKDTIEAVTGHKFNACLVNLYPDGKSVIGFHSDKETSLVPGSLIVHQFGRRKMV